MWYTEAHISAEIGSEVYKICKGPFCFRANGPLHVWGRMAGS